MHASGQYISSTFLVPAIPNGKNVITPQSFGSAVTYAKRYSLTAILGIAEEDDDGNLASGNESKQVIKTPTKKPTAARPVNTPNESIPQQTTKPATEQQGKLYTGTNDQQEKLQQVLKSSNVNTEYWTLIENAILNKIVTPKMLAETIQSYKNLDVAPLG